MQYPTDGQGFTYDDILKLSPYYSWHLDEITVIVGPPQRQILLGYRRGTLFNEYLELHERHGNDVTPPDIMLFTEEPPEITGYDQANIVYLLHILGFPVHTLRLTKSFLKLLTDFSLKSIVANLYDMGVLRCHLSYLKRSNVIKCPDHSDDSDD
jgi:hypothetical protein